MIFKKCIRQKNKAKIWNSKSRECVIDKSRHRDSQILELLNWNFKMTMTSKLNDAGEMEDHMDEEMGKLKMGTQKKCYKLNTCRNQK